MNVKSFNAGHGVIMIVSKIFEIVLPQIEQRFIRVSCDTVRVFAAYAMSSGDDYFWTDKATATNETENILFIYITKNVLYSPNYFTSQVCNFLPVFTSSVVVESGKPMEI